MTRFNLEKPYSNRPYNKPLIIEHIFGKTSAGNTKNENNSRKITKEAEMKTNIDRSTVIKATQKIVNNAVNNVSQKNSADVFNSIAASNSILLNGIECQVLNISDINQDAVTTADTTSTIIQKTINKVKTNITNSINKEISNDLPNNAADLMREQNKAMKDFMDSTPGLKKESNKPKRINGIFELVTGIAKSFNKENFLGGVEAGNTTNIDNSYQLNQKLKTEFNLDESFKVDDNDEVTNTISNSVNQQNIATCGQSAIANNNITLNDIKCDIANISKIKQTAVAKSMLTCTFNQTLVSDISTKIITKIEKRISRMMKAAKTDDDRKRIKKFGDAVGERLVNASGIKKSEENTNDSTKESSEKANKEPNEKANKESSEKANKESNEKANKESNEKANKEPNEKENKESNENMVVFMGISMTKLQKNILIGLGILLIIMLIGLVVSMLMSGNKNQNEYNKIYSEEAEFMDDSSDTSDYQ